MANKAAYSECKHIQRVIPDLTVTKDVAEAIGKEFRTLPIFEKGLFEHAYKKHYSLRTNDYLSCRWKEYKAHFEDRVFAPFTFIDLRDYHFYNCRNRFIPSESVHKDAEFRFKLRPGPGVDGRGQIPIPQELLKRGIEMPKGRGPKSTGEGKKSTGEGKKSTEKEGKLAKEGGINK